MSLRRPLLAAAALLALLSLAPSCTEDASPTGELVLVVTTDLALPADFDSLHLEVGRGSGDPVHQADYLFDGEPGLRLPATLVVTQANPGGGEVRARVVASRRGVPVLAREAVSSVPEARSAMLRLDLSWLCLERGVIGTARDARASCPSPTETCVAGACTPSSVAEVALPDYVPQRVFGGGATPAEGGCFDTIGCFARGRVASDLRPSDCSVARPPESSEPTVGINLALAGPSQGVCGANGCLVPLDSDTTTGWIERDGRLQLPASVCQGKRVVVVTTACTTKTAALPPCGPWSATGTAPAGTEAVVLPFDSSGTAPP